MIIKFFQFIRGSIEFEILAPDFGEFLKQASFIGKLYAVKQCKGKMLVTTSINTFKKLTPLIKKFGAKRRIVKKTGIPFILNKHRERKGVYIGFLSMLGLIFLLTRFVWTVDISGGNEEINKQILNSLNENGLKVGTVISKIDNRIIGNEILSDFPEISFISINIVGCRAIVEIDLIDELPDVTEPEVYGNIVAAKTGKIKVMEVYQGFSQVQVDDYVFEGELLVSGTKEDYFGRLIAVNSDAVIIAETECLYKVKLPVSENVAVRTGKKIKKRYLSLFNIDIPLHLNFFTKGNYETEVNSQKIELFGVTLPIVYTAIDMYEIETEMKEYSEADLEIRCEEIYKNEKELSFSEKEIVSENITKYYNNGFYCYEVSVTLRENIAKYVPFELEIEKNYTQTE